MAKSNNNAPKKTLEKPTTAEEKKKALDAALAHIEKQFGAGSVMRMGEKAALNVESIPTGSIGLDMALGIGGLPKGRIIEIFGPESGGKTTVTLHAIAEAQKRGGIAAFVDVEHALDPVYAKALGVDIDFAETVLDFREKYGFHILLEYATLLYRLQTTLYLLQGLANALDHIFRYTHN